jgi:HEAT repeat protein
MGAWTWKLATGASCLCTVVVVAWTIAKPTEPQAPRPEPSHEIRCPAAQPPAALLRAYPHLADSMQEDPVGALVRELGDARGVNRKCELLEALGALGDEQAATPLGEVVQSKQAARVRRCAVNALAKIVSPSATSWLSEFVRDPDSWVRYAAIHTLAEREDTFARQVIIDLTYDQDARLRQEATLALVEAGVPEAAEAIIAELAEADVETQVKYVRALRRSKNAAAVPALEALAVQGNESVRVAAIEAWAHIAGDQATEKLVALLDESTGRARTATLSALGEIGSDKARAALIKAAHADEAEIATGALQVLSEMEGDDVRALMLEELGGAERGRLEVAIAYCVDRGEEGAVPRLAELARAGLPWVRTQAVRALVQLGGPTSRETLLEIARQRGPMRQEVLRSLTEAGVPAEKRCELFERIVREGSMDSGAALALLAQEGGPMPTRILASVLDGDGPLVDQAAAALAAKGDEHSVALLARAARSSVPTTRLAALTYLGRSGHPRAASVLRAALDDEDERARSVAFDGMFALGGKHAENAALKLLRSDQQHDRQRALLAMDGMRSPTVREELARMARDEKVGGIAMSVLAELEPKRTASLAREAMGSGTPVRQTQALNIVSSLAPATAEPIVEAGLRSTDTNVLYSAVQSARRVHSDGVERELLTVMRNERLDFWVRQQAAHLLSTYGGSVGQQARDELKTMKPSPR